MTPGEWIVVLLVAIGAALLALRLGAGSLFRIVLVFTVLAIIGTVVWIFVTDEDCRLDRDAVSTVCGM